jgi:hypothetical protein
MKTAGEKKAEKHYKWMKSKIDARGGARPGAGRPTKPAKEMAKRIMVTLPPEQLDWLEQQPDKKSRTIQRLIAQEMESD